MASVISSFVIFLMFENHFFVLGYVRKEMNNHYFSGIHYQKKVQNSEIGELLREKEYFKIMEARIKKAKNPAGLVENEWF